MKSFKICLDMILKKITTSTEIHGKLNTPLTSPLAEHAAQKNFLSLKLPCIEVLTFSLKILDRRKTRNTSTKLISRHYSQEIMSCCRAILTITLFPNLTLLKNTKPVFVKLIIIIGYLVLFL